VLQAVRRYPALVIAPMLLLAALGAVIGYARTPTYKASSEVAVGQLNVSDPAAVGSVIQATNSLAAVYSRMIHATEVRRGIAKKVDTGGSQISATPIPGSPLIRVTATSDSESSAVAVTDAAARSLLAYAQRYGSSSDDSSAVYARYKAASLRVAHEQRRVGALASAFGRDRSAAGRQQLARAQSDLDAARLRREALKFEYGASLQTARSTPVLRMFSVAGGASSDRVSIMQILGLLGLIAGGAIGAALATAALKRRVAHLMSS
jgi:hypothetical protein